MASGFEPQYYKSGFNLVKDDHTIRCDIESLFTDIQSCPNKGKYCHACCDWNIEGLHEDQMDALVEIHKDSFYFCEFKSMVYNDTIVIALVDWLRARGYTITLVNSDSDTSSSSDDVNSGEDMLGSESSSESSSEELNGDLVVNDDDISKDPGNDLGISDSISDSSSCTNETSESNTNDNSRPQD